MKNNLKLFVCAALFVSASFVAVAEEKDSSPVVAPTESVEVDTVATLDSPALQQGLKVEVWTNTKLGKGELPYSPAPIVFEYTDSISIATSLYDVDEKKKPRNVKLRASGYIAIREKGEYSFVMEVKDSRKYASLQVGNEMVSTTNARQFITLKMVADAPGFYPIVIRRDAIRSDKLNFRIFYRIGNATTATDIAPEDCFFNPKQ